MDADEIAGLFAQYRTRIAAYAYAIVRDYHLVDDVLQDVAMILVRKAADYDPARAFLPWALGMTRRQALSLARRERRAITLEPEAMDRIESALVAAEDTEADRDRMAALSCCLEQLGAPGAALLRQKYVDGIPAETIAARSRRSREAVYSSLHRLRQRLADCVQRRLASEALG